MRRKAGLLIGLASLLLGSGCGSGGSSGAAGTGAPSGSGSLTLRLDAGSTQARVSDAAQFFRVLVTPVAGGSPVVLGDKIPRSQMVASAGVTFTAPLGEQTVEVDDFIDTTETSLLDRGTIVVTVVGGQVTPAVVTLFPLELRQFVYAADAGGGTVQAAPLVDSVSGRLGPAVTVASLPGIQRVALSSDGQFLFATVGSGGLPVARPAGRGAGSLPAGAAVTTSGLQAFKVSSLVTNGVASPLLTALGGVVPINPGDPTAQALGPLAVDATGTCVLALTSNINATPGSTPGIQSYRFVNQVLAVAGGTGPGGSAVNGSPLSVGTAIARASAGGTVRVAVVGAFTGSGDVESLVVDNNGVVGTVVSDLFAGLGVISVSNAFTVTPPSARCLQAIAFNTQAQNVNSSVMDVLTDGALTPAAARNVTLGSGSDIPTSVLYQVTPGGTPFIVGTSNGSGPNVFAFAIDPATGAYAADGESPVATETVTGPLISAGLLPPTATSGSFLVASNSALTNNIFSIPLSGTAPFLGTPTISTMSVTGPILPEFPVGTSVIQ